MKKVAFGLVNILKRCFISIILDPVNGYVKRDRGNMQSLRHCKTGIFEKATSEQV